MNRVEACAAPRKVLKAPAALRHLAGPFPVEYSGGRGATPGGPGRFRAALRRIPGAKHLFFEDLLDANKAFKPVEEIQRIVAATGAAADKDIITYCRMSHRATVLQFVLTELLKYKRVKVYDGSWTEWGNLVNVPVER